MVTDERSDRDANVAADDSPATEPARRSPEITAAPAVAQVRDEDLEPHAGLRYIARLFKGLAVLIAFMLIAEVIIGLQQDGTAAIGLLLVQATRLVVFACFLWGAGDIALMLIESNHDARASRILLGRINNKLEQAIGPGAEGGGSTLVPPGGSTTGAPPAEPRGVVDGRDPPRSRTGGAGRPERRSAPR